MEIVLYIGGILMAFLMTALGVWRFGKRPSRKDLTVGFVGAALLSFILLSCTVILSHQGNSSRLPLFYFSCLWAILATARSNAYAGLGILFYFVLFLPLSFHHAYLAHLAHYTDNPQARLRSVHVQNLSATKQGKPPIALPHIIPTVHTWLTGLYRVEPSMGGSDSR